MTTQLRLAIERKYEQTVIADSFFTSPLKLGAPARRGDRLHLIFMMASAGLLKGDTFDYEITCAPGTRLLLTEQSYTKVFDTGDGGASKRQHITLAGDASLLYRPSAVIPFAGSTYDGDLVVDLEAESEFAWADIMTAGRIAMNERFAFRHFRNRVCVRRDGLPIWMDHCLLEPASMDVDGIYYFDGWTHQGVFYYYGSAERMERIRSWFTERSTAWDILPGITDACEGLCIRILAHSAQDIEECFAEAEAQIV